MRSIYRRLRPAAHLVAAVAVAAATLVPAAALAHEGREVGDYHFVVGWTTEPALEGLMNGVDLRVTAHAHDDAASAEPTEGVDEHGELFSQALQPGETYAYEVGADLLGQTVPFHDHVYPEYSGAFTVSETASDAEMVHVMIEEDGYAPAEFEIRPGATIMFENMASAQRTVVTGQHPDAEHSHDEAAQEAEEVPVEGLEETLEVEVTHVPSGVSRTFALRAVFGQPGHYTADVIPTAPGQYRFHFVGEIEGQPIDEVFESGEGTFDDVHPATDVQFPEAVAAAREVEGAARAAQDAAFDAEDQASSARTLALAGLGVGALGVMVGGAGLALALRRR